MKRLTLCHFQRTNFTQLTAYLAIKLLHYYLQCDLIKTLCYSELILTDFERAAINAFGKAFPLTNLGGCRFHLAHVIILNVNECELKHKYINGYHIRIRVKCLQALSLMPEPIVIECFELINGDFEDDELAVFNYFERTCNGAINPRSKDGSRRIALISGLYETDHS